MGIGVARSLRRGGFDVNAYDVRREVSEQFASEGGTACESPADVGARCSVVIVLVVNAEQTEQALFGSNGAAYSMTRGSVVVASATCHPDFVRQLGARLADLGIELLDAPVSGGVAGAASATLTVIASGPSSAHKKCEHVLASISSSVFCVGDELGLGSRVKIINQLLVGVHIATAAEAMALGIRAGVQPDLLYEVIVASAGNSWAFQDRGPRMVAGDFTAKTTLDIFVKDLALVLDSARSSDAAVPLAMAAYQLFARAAAEGHGKEDDSAVIKAFAGNTRHITAA